MLSGEYVQVEKAILYTGANAAEVAEFIGNTSAFWEDGGKLMTRGAGTYEIDPGCVVTKNLKVFMSENEFLSSYTPFPKTE